MIEEETGDFVISLNINQVVGRICSDPPTLSSNLEPCTNY